jgi:PhnB protein
MARKAKAGVKAKAKASALRRAALPKSKAPKRKAPKSRAKLVRKAKPSVVPAGYGSVQPYLIVHDAAAAIAYYKSVFGARERMRLPMPNGKLGHAELVIGGAVVMLADESPDWNAHGPRKFGGSPVSIMMYVKDVDDTVKKAVAAGGKLTREVRDQFYGDRSGGIEDPFGHRWHIATHVEDVSPKEMDRRVKAFHQPTTPPKPDPKAD